MTKQLSVLIGVLVGVLLFTCFMVLHGCGTEAVRQAASAVTVVWEEEVPEAHRPLVQTTQEIFPTLINGNPVQPGQWKQTVRIRTNNSGCTASVVGPRVLATAAHCAATGATSVFTLDGVNYSAKISRHPIYPNRDMDIALGVIDKEVVLQEYSILPDKVDVVKVGDAIRLMGYGCTKPGGGGGNDGVLREGMSTVTGFQGFDIVTGKSGEAALCFGDSGGPAFIQADGKLFNISQNSKGDISRTSYLARWDVKEAQDWVRKWIADNGNIEVCGINKDCGKPPPPQNKFSVEGATVALSGTIKNQFDKDYVENVIKQAVAYLDSNEKEKPVFKGEK